MDARLAHISREQCNDHSAAQWSNRFESRILPPRALRAVFDSAALLLLTWAAEAPRRMTTMLWTIAVVLIVLWLLGMVSAYTMGGFIHILLVLAIIMVLVRVIQGRRPVG
jgi:hypothetical protein